MITKDILLNQMKRINRSLMKPKGIWISIDPTWKVKMLNSKHADLRENKQ